MTMWWYVNVALQRAEVRMIRWPCGVRTFRNKIRDYTYCTYVIEKVTSTVRVRKNAIAVMEEFSGIIVSPITKSTIVQQRVGERREGKEEGQEMEKVN